jgi:hypothetical protein
MDLPANRSTHRPGGLSRRAGCALADAGPPDRINRKVISMGDCRAGCDDQAARVHRSATSRAVVGAAVGRAWVPRFRRPVEVWLGLALLAGPLAPSLARSASPPVDGMEAASATLDEAEQMLAADDVDAAIALFEAALGPDPDRTRVCADAGAGAADDRRGPRGGFARDGDLERLRRAKRLLDRYLGPLELLDEQGRAAAEERRVRLIDAIGAVEEKLRAEEAARAATARRERAGQGAPAGPAPSRHRGGADGPRRRRPGSLMASGLGLGRATDEQIEQAARPTRWREATTGARRASTTRAARRGARSSTRCWRAAIGEQRPGDRRRGDRGRAGVDRRHAAGGRPPHEERGEGARSDTDGLADELRGVAAGALLMREVRR